MGEALKHLAQLRLMVANPNAFHVTTGHNAVAWALSIVESIHGEAHRPFVEDRAFADWPVELQAAVNAYDETRRTSYGRQNEQEMSDANKSSIAPMIMAAVRAFYEAAEKEADRG